MVVGFQITNCNGEISKTIWVSYANFKTFHDHIINYLPCNLSVLWNVETNTTTILVGAETVGQVSISASFVDFAPDDKSLLLFYDNQ